MTTQNQSMKRRTKLRSIATTCAFVYSVFLMVLLHSNDSNISRNGRVANFSAFHNKTSHMTDKNNNPGLQTSTFTVPSSLYKIDPNDIWEEPSSILPDWMKQYFRWHKETRHHQHHNRILVVTCLANYPKCGGFADRLSSLPFFVRVAAQSRRLLLFQWGRPCELEDLLLPPQFGIDWRVRPEEYDIQKNGNKATVQDVIVQQALRPDLDVLRVKFQSHDHGANFYNAALRPHEPSFEQVFRACWNVFFTPVPAIAQRVTSYLYENNLRPNQYVAAHLRALYNAKKRDMQLVDRLSHNALNCTSQLIQQQSIQSRHVYFAADLSYATEEAVDYGMNQRLQVSAIQHETNPLHLDKTRDWKERKPADFYDTVVELYLMALARCVTYGMGGYGKLAALLSYNVSCSMQHHTARTINSCELEKQLNQNQPMILKNDKDTSSFLLPPMPLHDDLEGKQKIPTSSKDLFPNVNSLSSDRIWESSKLLPGWMKRYFAWHSEQRERMTNENWEDFRHLVMVCTKRDAKCGGAADRLRPLPAIIQVAADTNRILWIMWEKPAPLEEFLVPPVGGVDWRVPDWFGRKIRGNNERVTSIEKLVARAEDATQVIVKAKLQENNHGADFYNERQGRKDTDFFSEQYRDCWFSLFTPALPVAAIIEHEMERMHLRPGGFAIAHLRAHYGRENVGRDAEHVLNWTKNSLNCLSELRPGGPFFFSSDSGYARQVAVDYGRSRNVSVVTRLEDKDPLHLDLVEDWTKKQPSDFYSTFVDLYIMSFGDCMSYNMGGFGRWGQLLSGRNLSCTVRHWTAGVPKRMAKKEGCEWQYAVPTDVDNTKVPPLELPLFLPGKAKATDYR